MSCVRKRLTAIASIAVAVEISKRPPPASGRPLKGNTNPLAAMSRTAFAIRFIAAGLTPPRGTRPALASVRTAMLVAAFTPGRPAGMSNPGNWQNPCHRRNRQERHNRHRRQNWRPARQLRAMIVTVVPTGPVVTIAPGASRAEQTRAITFKDLIAPANSAQLAAPRPGGL